MILSARNIVGEAAISAESPNAASSEWTMQPSWVPVAAAMPAGRPPATVLASHRLMSGPGVTNSTKPASVKASRTEASGTNDIASAGSVQGGEQALEHLAAVGAAEQGLEQALGMRHHAEHAPGRIADAGDVALRAVRVGRLRCLSGLVDVAEDHPAFTLELIQRCPVGEVVAVAVSDGDADHLVLHVVA